MWRPQAPVLGMGIWEAAQRQRAKALFQDPGWMKTSSISSASLENYGDVPAGPSEKEELLGLCPRVKPWSGGSKDLILASWSG